VSEVAPPKLVVGNWKMNLGEGAARDLVRALIGTLPPGGVDAAVAPAFPVLRAALDAASGSALAVAAQNVHWEERGAFTGEVAPGMLAEMGVRFVLVGHSERRAQFGETDAEVGRKVVACRRHRLVPVVCVGETEAQRDAGRTIAVVTDQTVAAIRDLAPGDGGLVLAYEPVWAIGTGKVPREEDVAAAHEAIRIALASRLESAAAAVRILYGGSVNARNARALLSVPGVSGALVGGASLDPEAFVAIASAAA
jgi:triosephosphate isomerase (TIM)